MYDRLLLIRVVTLCINLPCLILLTYPIIVKPLIMEVPFIIIGLTLLIYNLLSFLGSCIKNYVNQPHSVKQSCTEAFWFTLDSLTSALGIFHLFTVTLLPLVIASASTLLYLQGSLDLTLLLSFALLSIVLLLLGVSTIVTLIERIKVNRERLEYDVLV
ncbi:Transmembrane domain-containing protein [Brazilian cedratvirus IHUMI]|uniref:Transmembrane domain-containing protein n=1 Tax=Brazilian cedratvirus IHUMI TaxID=2126980 RepID=A0A2R8FE66_9VIRU|nr:Transmembrane domain-containing protein [Brazilian cedratvirus IHUMI]